jgi:periplasmic protein TonB
MERRLFDQLTLSSAGDRRRRSGSLPLSLAVHAGALGAVLFVPVLTSTDLPAPAVSFDVLAAPAILVPPPPPPRGVPPRPFARHRPPAPSPPTGRAITLPTSWSDVPVPTGREWEATDLPECEGCVPWGLHDGVPTGAAMPTEQPPPPPAIRVDSRFHPPVKLHDVAPVYPDLAREARIEGVVVIECRIDTDGRVVDARVLSGHPLLDAAALDAVGQWRYRATLLNGQPVAVLMTVTVRFSLRR